MNILVICHYGLYRDLDASFVHNQVREYAALGHRVRAIVPIGWGKADRAGRRFGAPLQRQERDGVEIFDLRYLTVSSRGEKGFNARRAMGAIARHWDALLGDFTPDVIHAHTLGFDSMVARWLKERLACPVLLTTHGSDTVVPLQRGEGAWLARLCDGCDCATAVSRPLAEALRSTGTKTPVVTVYNGYIPRERPAVARDPWAMIQVGHLIPSKKFDLTIRCLARLRSTYPRLHLTAVGEGPLRAELEALCRQLGVADAVTFTGPLPNAEVFARMCESRFYTMASHPEGFGIVYLEAMAAGCITLGTEGQGVADVIRHGENGFLVPPSDEAAVEAMAAALRLCIEDPARGDAIAAAGRAESAGYTWRAAGEKYLALLEQLAAGR